MSTYSNLLEIEDKLNCSKFFVLRAQESFNKNCTVGLKSSFITQTMLKSSIININACKLQKLALMEKLRPVYPCEKQKSCLECIYVQWDVLRKAHEKIQILRSCMHVPVSCVLVTINPQTSKSSMLLYCFENIVLRTKISNSFFCNCRKLQYGFQTTLCSNPVRIFSTITSLLIFLKS